MLGARSAPSVNDDEQTAAGWLLSHAVTALTLNVVRLTGINLRLDDRALLTK